MTAYEKLTGYKIDGYNYRIEEVDNKYRCVEKVAEFTNVCDAHHMLKHLTELYKDSKNARYFVMIEIHTGKTTYA